MLKGNIYFFAKENLFSESEDTVYINIVGHVVAVSEDRTTTKKFPYHIDKRRRHVSVFLNPNRTGDQTGLNHEQKII